MIAVSTGETQSGPAILVVDDEPAVREALRAGLEFEGYQVTTAADGLGALEQIAKAMPDGMVLDVMMPRMDGLTMIMVTHDSSVARRAQRLGTMRNGQLIVKQTVK